MQIKIKVDPNVNDLMVIVGMINALTELAAKVNPDQAMALRKDVGYRLKRMAEVTT